MTACSSRSIRRSRRAVTNDTKKELPRKLQRWCAWPICGPNTPSSAPLTRQVLAKKNRSYTSICGQFETYQYATHDDWNYDDWNSKIDLIPMSDRAGRIAVVFT